MKNIIKNIEKDRLYFYCDIFKKIDAQKQIKEAAELEISQLEKLIFKTPIIQELRAKYKDLYL